MSKEEDVVHDAVERLEWDERKEEETPFKKMRQLTRRTALTGGAAGIGALILQACGGSSSSSSSGGGSSSSATATGTASAATGGQRCFGDLRVQHGLQVHAGQPRHHQPVLHADAERRGRRVQAARLLLSVDRLAEQQRRRDGQRVQQRRSAPASTASAVALVDLHAFNAPTTKALAAKIPVVAYNADAAGNARLAYIGQDLFVSGQEMGQHIIELVPSGDVALFIATPGSLNIQPRIDGAQRRSSRTRASRPTSSRPGRPCRRSCRRSSPTPRRTPSTKGYLRRRRREHPEHRPGDPEAEPARKGGQGRRV